MTTLNYIGTFPFNNRKAYKQLFKVLHEGGMGLATDHKITCTYAVECLTTGRAYVGSTRNFFTRWRAHLQHLRNDTHSNIPLQDLYNEHGVDNFVFKILTTTTPAKMLVQEYADGMALYGEADLLNYVLGLCGGR